MVDYQKIVIFERYLSISEKKPFRCFPVAVILIAI